jgi:hypothetical protein
MKDLAFDHWDDLTYMVCKENDNQLSKWGYQDVHPYGWMIYLSEEVGELAKAITEQVERGEATDAEIALEAIQVATLSLKIAEMHLYRRQSTGLEATPLPLWEPGQETPDGRPIGYAGGEPPDIETVGPNPEDYIPSRSSYWDLKKESQSK